MLLASQIWEIPLVIVTLVDFNIDVIVRIVLNLIILQELQFVLEVFDAIVFAALILALIQFVDVQVTLGTA